MARGRIEPPTFRFQVNRAERCTDRREPTSPTSGTALGGSCNSNEFDIDEAAAASGAVSRFGPSVSATAPNTGQIAT